MKKVLLTSLLIASGCGKAPAARLTPPTFQESIREFGKPAMMPGQVAYQMDSRRECKEYGEMVRCTLDSTTSVVKDRDNDGTHDYEHVIYNTQPHKEHFIFKEGSHFFAYTVKTYEDGGQHKTVDAYDSHLAMIERKVLIDGDSDGNNNETHYWTPGSFSLDHYVFIDSNDDGIVDHMEHTFTGFDSGHMHVTHYIDTDGDSVVDRSYEEWINDSDVRVNWKSRSYPNWKSTPRIIVPELKYVQTLTVPVTF